MNKTRSTLRHHTARLATLLIACLFANLAFATDYYNFGTDGSRIGVAAEYSNTDGSAVAATVNPGAGDNLFFFNSTAGAGPLDRRLEVGASNLSFNSMTFGDNAGAIQIDRGATGSSTAQVISIGSGGLTLDSGAGPVSFGRLADSGNEQRVIVGAIADFTISNNSASDLTFVRDFDGRLNNTTNVVTVAGAGAGNTVFAAGIKANSSGRDLAMVIDTTGSGAVRIDDAGTYTGGTTLEQGTLQVRSSTALGTGALTINGGTLASIISPRTLANTVTVGGDFALGGSGQATILNGTMDLGSATRVITTANSATFGGVVSNGGITKQGSAALTLTAANTYTGSTTVSAGSLIINGDQSAATGVLTVAANATLGGSGSIGGATTISGTLSPGNSPGDITFNDSLLLNSTATLTIEITGINIGNFDRVVGTGSNTFDFGGTLALDNTGYSASLGDSINIFSNWGSFTGTFDTITGTDLGGGLSWDTTNLGTTGTIVVVPEPSTYALLKLGALGLGAHILRRRRKA